MNDLISIPEGWKEATLPEIGTIGRGKSKHRPRWAPHLYGGEYPFIQTGQIKSARKYIKKYAQTYTEAGLAQSKLWNKNTMCITIAANIAEIAILEFPACFPDSVLGFVANDEKCDLDFIFYNFKMVQAKLRQLAIGSVQDNINLGTFEKIQFLIPPLPEQKSIASILTSFDKKIELLEAQNKTLEAIAQTIFKEWFGKYQMGDELPEGWKEEELGHLLELIIDYRGKTPLKLGFDWSEKGIPALSAKSIKNGKIVRRDAMNLGSEELYKTWMKDELQKGDILLTSEAPLGEMYYLNDDTKYILSQRLFALRTNEKITPEYLYHYLFSKNGQHLLQARASGSTVQGIRQSELRKIEVIIPEKKFLEKASNIFKPIFDKTFANAKQIQTLAKTRDSLLPKLMSGAIRVNQKIKAAT